jgi:pantoate--beta-alanine ligase
MIIFKKAGDLHQLLDQQKKSGKQVGFVPTMGALHEGHLSLVIESGKHNDISVASIFVNPTQFNDPLDFQKYPVTLEKDISMFEAAGCDVLFIPLVQEMYPIGTNNLEYYDLGVLETILEGKFRPGHFQGVCQVVHRLLNIVLPRNLYLGQKDYQQCMVIKKMTELVGLNEIKVNVCPTLRENDGLAMSSRNARLSPDERKKAATISAALRYIKENIKQGSIKNIKEEATQMLLQNDFRPDYVEVADANSLELMDEWDGKQKIVALIAAFINNVRLIDNMVINE